MKQIQLKTLHWNNPSRDQVWVLRGGRRRKRGIGPVKGTTGDVNSGSIKSRLGKGMDSAGRTSRLEGPANGARGEPPSSHLFRSVDWVVQIGSELPERSQAGGRARSEHLRVERRAGPGTVISCSASGASGRKQIKSEVMNVGRLATLPNLSPIRSQSTTCLIRSI